MDIEEQAIRYLFQSDPEKVFGAPEIIKTLGLRGKAAKRLPQLLREMVRSGELVEKRRGHYRAGAGSGTMTGTVRLTRSGAAIVTDEEILYRGGQGVHTPEGAADAGRKGADGQ